VSFIPLIQRKKPREKDSCTTCSKDGPVSIRRDAILSAAVPIFAKLPISESFKLPKSIFVKHW